LPESNTDQNVVAVNPAQQPDQSQQPVVAQQPAPQTVQQPSQVPAQPAVVQPAPSLENLAQQIVQQAPVVPQAPAKQTFELPEGVTDRTKDQFDKLTDSNKKLLQANRILQTELSRRAQTESMMAPLQQVAQPQQPDVTQFVEVDPISGEQYVNEKKLQEAIVQANDRALRAEKQVQDYIVSQQRKEDQKQTAEAYANYPQLDPNNLEKFDSELNRVTRAYALDSMLNPQEYGRTLTFKEAADLAAKQLAGKQIPAPSVEAQQISNQAQPTVIQNANQTQQPTVSVIKEQGGIAAEGLPVNVNPQQGDEDLLALQQKTRKGDMWALAKRLTKVPHTGTPTHSDEAGGEA
jgi:hypothetical protein